MSVRNNITTNRVNVGGLRGWHHLLRACDSIIKSWDVNNKKVLFLGNYSLKKERKKLNTHTGLSTTFYAIYISNHNNIKKKFFFLATGYPIYSTII